MQDNVQESKCLFAKSLQIHLQILYQRHIHRQRATPSRSQRAKTTPTAILTHCVIHEGAGKRDPCDVKRCWLRRSHGAVETLQNASRDQRDAAEDGATKKGAESRSWRWNEAGNQLRGCRCTKTQEQIFGETNDKPVPRVQRKGEQYTASARR
jgi:hypothetical protein